MYFCPFRALGCLSVYYPGRCPGLWSVALSGRSQLALALALAFLSAADRWLFVLHSNEFFTLRSSLIRRSPLAFLSAADRWLFVLHSNEFFTLRSSLIRRSPLAFLSAADRWLFVLHSNEFFTLRSSLIRRSPLAFLSAADRWLFVLHSNEFFTLRSSLFTYIARSVVLTLFNGLTLQLLCFFSYFCNADKGTKRKGA